MASNWIEMSNVSSGHSGKETISPLSVLDGKSVLVTGGTGSFGRAFTRAVLLHSNVRRLAVLSRDEMKQTEMSQELASLDRASALRFFIGDVRDEKRIVMA